jgi:hypothetical protein
MPAACRSIREDFDKLSPNGVWIPAYAGMKVLHENDDIYFTSNLANFFSTATFFNCTYTGKPFLYFG